jgi:hypothetical protein
MLEEPASVFLGRCCDRVNPCSGAGEGSDHREETEQRGPMDRVFRNVNVNTKWRGEKSLGRLLDLEVKPHRHRDVTGAPSSRLRHEISHIYTL